MQLAKEIINTLELTIFLAINVQRAIERTGSLDASDKVKEGVLEKRRKHVRAQMHFPFGNTGGASKIRRPRLRFKDKYALRAEQPMHFCKQGPYPLVSVLKVDPL